MKKRTIKKNKQLQSSGPALRGRYTALRNGGGGFVTPLDAQGRVCGEDIFIPAHASGGAWHQDIVLVQCAAGRRRPGLRQEGRIAGIEARGLAEIPAHMARRRGGWLECVPADGRLNFRLRVPVPEGEEMPHTGDLLVIAPEHALDEGLWLGRLVARMGREDDVRVQEELVKCNHETPREFPPRVLAEAEALPGEPGPEDWRDREDLRDAVLVTIDGEDARDFDDAVEVTPEADGWLLRVAIADVSHYVRPRTALDTEALARGNSWYFPASVEPMLPPALSNGLCSLNPDANRLCLTAEVRFNRRGLPVSARFFPAVMRSAARLTYEEIISRVYREPSANRFLASLAPFVHSRMECPEIREMVSQIFREFARRNLKRYPAGLTVACLGGIAAHFEQPLREALADEGLRVGTIVESPAEGLIRYHHGEANYGTEFGIR